MADDGTGAGQEPTGDATGTGQEPTGQQGTEQQGGQGAGPADPDLTAITDPNLRAWVEAQAKAARENGQEAAAHRVKLREAQQQITDLRQAHETDEQRAQRESAERDERFKALEAENRSLKVLPQFTTKATAAKALDPAALLTLVGGLEAIQVGDDGKATNLDALIATARTQYPYLFGRTNADGPGGREGEAPAAGGGINALIRGRGTSQAR